MCVWENSWTRINLSFYPSSSVLCISTPLFLVSWAYHAVSSTSRKIILANLLRSVFSIVLHRAVFTWSAENIFFLSRMLKGSTWVVKEKCFSQENVVIAEYRWRVLWPRWASSLSLGTQSKNERLTYQLNFASLHAYDSLLILTM